MKFQISNFLSTRPLQRCLSYSYSVRCQKRQENNVAGQRQIIHCIKRQYCVQQQTANQFAHARQGIVSSGVKEWPTIDRLNSLPVPRTFSTSPMMKSINPRMLYLQNPLVWLSNRWEFYLLRTQWDANFKLKEFLRGCKQALCTTTQFIADGKYDDLKGLIAVKTLEKLKEEIGKEWNENQRKAVALTLEEIHVVLPHRVYLRTNYTDKRFCDVDMILVAFKPKHRETKHSVGLLIEVAARFHRNYSEGSLPDWTITHLHMKSRDVQIKEK